MPKLDVDVTIDAENKWSDPVQIFKDRGAYEIANASGSTAPKITIRRVDEVNGDYDVCTIEKVPGTGKLVLPSGVYIGGCATDDFGDGSWPLRIYNEE